MDFLTAIGQIVIALAVSGIVATLIGPAYLAMALLVLAVCLILLYQAEQTHSETIEEPVSMLALARIGATALVFGLIWPAIPVVLTYRRVDERRA